MKKNRYNKKLKYRENPELIDDFDYGFFITIFIATAIPTLILTWLEINNYFPLSLSIGFASLVLIVLYKLIIRPQIYKGNIRAYYRRKYENISKVNNKFFIAITVLISRFILFSIESLIKENDILQSINLQGILITIAIFSLMLYLSFFQEKYTTIKEYSDKINYEMKFNNRNYKDALELFYKKKDKEHGVKEFDGTYFNYEKEPMKQNERKESKFIRREMRKENERNFMDKEDEKRL